jgi:hypothetical protein
LKKERELSIIISSGGPGELALPILGLSLHFWIELLLFILNNPAITHGKNPASSISLKFTGEDVPRPD